tara:strand:+ start:12418 stop:12876 length:459 start_codon:yes stop_codon:yes gene_type:complete
MTKIIYPSDYNDELKAIYDDLYSRGLTLVGKKIRPQDEFLLDLSAKITINQMRGIDNNLSKEQIEEMKQMHLDNSSGVIITPPELYEDGLMRTADGKSVIRHPLDVPQEEVFDKTRIAPPPKDVNIHEPVEEENDDVDITILNTKIDEMLDF